MLSARLNRYYGRLRRPPGQPSTSRFQPVIGRHAPAAPSAGCRAGEGLPSSRRHPRYVPRPLRRGVPHGCASRLFTASMAFTLIMGARHSLAPPSTGGNGYDAAGFASCCGPHRRSPFTGLLTLGSDPARFPAEPPACYRASWQLPGPDFHRQATTSLRTRRTPRITSRCYLPFCWAHGNSSLSCCSLRAARGPGGRARGTPSGHHSRSTLSAPSWPWLLA